MWRRLGRLLLRWQLKWIFAAGLGFGVVGNLIGYLGIGWWFANCKHADGNDWKLF